jgi:hypothetical protein
MEFPPLSINRRKLLSTSLALGALPLTTLGSATAARAAAALLGPWQPKFFRFKLGAFEITTISDSEAFIDGPFTIIGAKADESDVH